MLFAWLYYLVRVVFWILFWPLRLLGKSPDYVLIELRPGMPALESNPRGWRKYVGARRKLSVWRLTDQLQKLAKRPAVRGVIVLLRPGDFGAAQAEAIHKALAAFRDAGREVVVWTKGLDLQRLAMASAATRLVLSPGGHVGPLGMHRDMLYFGEALSGLGVKLDIIHSGPHKSAYEPFTATEPSPEVSEMLGWLFDSIYGSACALIAKGRHVNEAAVNDWIDEGLMTDERALKVKLVDAIAGEAATVRELSKGAQKPARIMPFDKVERWLRGFPERPMRSGVAVLRVEGAIVDGVSRQPPIGLPVRGLSRRCGDLTLIAECRQLAASRRIKSVVLYIDSPGGSAAASEAMADALGDLAAKKPLIAVMGATAASGGYYVATAARKILASRTTLTGSIGVIMAKVVNSGLLGRLNVHPHALKRGERADMFSGTQPFTDAERNLLTEHMERSYRIFVKRVADARALATDVVDNFGRGRVWTGSQAVNRGLVDEIGGFGDALAIARTLGDLPPDSPVFAPAVPAGKWLPPRKLDDADADAYDPTSFGAVMDWLGDGASWVSSGKPLALSQVMWRLLGK